MDKDKPKRKRKKRRKKRSKIYQSSLREVYKFCCTYVDSYNGLFPRVADIAAGLNISSSNAYKKLSELCRQGVVYKEDRGRYRMKTSPSVVVIRLKNLGFGVGADGQIRKYLPTQPSMDLPVGPPLTYYLQLAEKAVKGLGQ